MDAAIADVKPRGRARPRTLRDDFVADAETQIAASMTLQWPNAKYVDDPVGFARDVLGVELWAGQVEIVESIRDNRNTTVRSGHKCGKTTALAVAAIWFYCCFARARVLMTAVKASQVDEVMWKEVRRLVKESRKRGTPVDGELHELARSGLRADDERQIWGATARDGEGLAGISGPNILILVDEASGVHDRFFEVLGTSLAGSGGTVRKCYISNPTRTSGEFFKSHTTYGDLFHKIHLSSEDTPNARGAGNVPGLAGPVWIREMLNKCGGEDSYEYRVRVRGDFVHDKDGKIISRELITLAQEAWDEAADEGDLQIGIDPAGDGVGGDEIAIAVRRGKKIVTVLTWQSLSEEAIVAHALAALATHRQPRETERPRIAVDAEGGIGSRVLGLLRAHEDRADFDLVAVRSGKKFWGSPEYHLIRDGLWGQAAAWVKSGGAIPADIKLAQDLNAPVFTADVNRRYRATDKKVLRKELGRSTDRGDAVCLAIWQGPSAGDAHDDTTAHVPLEVESYQAYDAGAVFNPYGGAG